MRKLTFIPLLLILTTVATAQTQPKPDADFPFLGEYVGEMEGGGGTKQKFGAQVIALGDGKFHDVFYPGGLPGDGWTKDKPKVTADGARIDDSVSFAGSRLGGTIKDGVLV